MQRSDYDAYVAAFNRADFERFAAYYTDDVVFQLGDMREFHGRDQILDFYREVKSRVRETMTVLKFVADASGVAAEIETEFLALEDWPDFVSGPLYRNDVFRRRGLIMYDLRDDRFSYTRSGRTQVLESPWS